MKVTADIWSIHLFLLLNKKSGPVCGPAKDKSVIY